VARILYLSANAIPGGAERATIMMARAHDRARFEPSILFFNDGPLVREASAAGIAVRRLATPLRLRSPLAVGRAIREVAHVIRQQGVDIVHSCMSYAHLIGGPAAAFAGVPAVLYQHGPVDSWMDGAATLVRCSRIAANSAFTAAAQRSRGWRERPVIVVPLATDMSLSIPERSALRAQIDARHRLDSGMTAIGIIGRFDPRKGIHVALAALAPLLRSRPALRLLIVGGRFGQFHPGYDDRLRSIADAEGLGEQVVFTGYQSDVRPYLARMDVLVQPSLEPEAFGMTLIEAMACGVPVAASRGGGASEVVDDGVNGLLHEPGNGAELLESVTRLLDDQPLRTRLGRAALQKVDAHYRPAAMIARLEAVYDDLLASHASLHAAPLEHHTT
jgi:glycosyltransferase involved in cell wall biosynthesis